MKMRKLAALVLAALMALCLCACTAMAEDAAQSVDLSGHIVILHTNDALGNADGKLGYSRVAVAKERLEGAGATVILLDAGNALYGAPLANVSTGEDVVKLMNAVGYDAMTVGSHDLALGAERLTELAAQAQFQLISANLVKDDGANLLSGSAIIEKGNVKFGVFGLIAPSVMGRAEADMNAADPIEAAKAQAAALEAENCSVIIALAHIGADENAELTAKMLAEQVEGIDVIITGHSDAALEDGVWVNNTLVVCAGGGIENIGCVDIDGTGLTAATLLTDEDFGEADVDAEINALIKEIRTAQEAQLNEVIGQTSVELNGAAESVCAGETNLGSLAADALRSAAGADIALISGGSFSGLIPAGDISLGQLASVFEGSSFGVKLSVTGEQLTAILEHGVGMAPAADTRFPQVSGVTFKYDETQPAGSRVFDVKVNGEAIDAAKTYLLATTNAVAAGEGEYPLNGAPMVGEYGALYELLGEYISSFETAIAPEVEGRSAAEAK